MFPQQPFPLRKSSIFRSMRPSKLHAPEFEGIIQNIGSPQVRDEEVLEVSALLQGQGWIDLTKAWPNLSDSAKLAILHIARTDRG